MKKNHFVLVHGTGHGAWCWYKLVTLLKSSGHQVTALDLGGSGIDSRRLDEVSSISDYVSPLIEFMASLGEQDKVVLVGHSFGGISISLAIERFPTKVLAAVFVTAIMPSFNSPPANVVMEFFKRTPTESLMDSRVNFGDGPENLPTSALFGSCHMAQRIYQNCQIQDVELGKLLIRETGLFLKDLSEKSLLTEERFGSVKRVYIVAEEDQLLKKELQEWFIQNSPTEEVKYIPGADHMVMLSKPDDLYSSLLGIK
ncbi:Methylesterase 10 [Linum grandiflorum]